MIILDVNQTYSQIYGLFVPQKTPVPLSDTFWFVLLSVCRACGAAAFAELLLLTFCGQAKDAEGYVLLSTIYCYLTV